MSPGCNGHSVVDCRSGGEVQLKETRCQPVSGNGRRKEETDRSEGLNNSLEVVECCDR